MRRFIHLSLLSAWLCASGATLDLAQVFAWGRMFAGYARTESLSAAALETFDPAKPCAICRAVDEARSAAGAKAPATLHATDKLVMISELPAQFLAVGETPAWPVTGDRRATARVNDVPVPPPRGAASVLSA